jgi:hypothetical protein
VIKAQQSCALVCKLKVVGSIPDGFYYFFFVVIHVFFIYIPVFFIFIILKSTIYAYVIK